MNIFLQQLVLDSQAAQVTHTGRDCQEKFKNRDSYMEKLYLLGNMHYYQDVIAIDAEAKYSFIYFFSWAFK